MKYTILRLTHATLQRQAESKQTRDQIFTARNGTNYEGKPRKKVILAPGYYPQADGITERAIQTLQGKLTMGKAILQKPWPQILPIAIDQINKSF
jgi:hypothetical protein